MSATKELPPGLPPLALPTSPLPRGSPSLLPQALCVLLARGGGGADGRKMGGGWVVTAGLLWAPGERRRLLTLDKLGKNRRAELRARELELRPGKQVGLGSGCEMGCTARPGPGWFGIALAPWDEGCVKASRGVVCFLGPPQLQVFRCFGCAINLP